MHLKIINLELLLLKIIKKTNIAINEFKTVSRYLTSGITSGIPTIGSSIITD
jgi:hypothetical protein